ncbi:helix-turn-helix transcriptional regulator [Fusobacterium polymorphum]|uniref:helix-turn-helix domain-containing protein n=1 Tax=Fusobacterium nucleatum subsp. polymorphum TaxID=76857 RepID=UPI002B4BD175|nr:helix-turn-helix transcriptional regulator [Fusobacterium polymorphum]WRL71102.1 helix-turn-helix transcriptional regulator [Fusobacterium polymorphum]
MKLNEMIKLLRNNTNLTQKEMAKKLGVSLSSLQKYEYGDFKPSSDILKKMSEVFKIPVSVILNVDDYTEDERDMIIWDIDIADENKQNLKTNRENINFILENDLIPELNDKKKFLLYYMINIKNFSFHIPNDKSTLELYYYDSNNDEEISSLMKTERLNLLLDMLDDSFELIIKNFSKLTNLNLIDEVIKKDSNK